VASRSGRPQSQIAYRLCAQWSAHTIAFMADQHEVFLKLVRRRLRMGDELYMPIA